MVSSKRRGGGGGAAAGGARGVGGGAGGGGGGGGGGLEVMSANTYREVSLISLSPCPPSRKTITRKSKKFKHALHHTTPGLEYPPRNVHLSICQEPTIGLDIYHPASKPKTPPHKPIINIATSHHTTPDKDPFS